MNTKHYDLNSTSINTQLAYVCSSHTQGQACQVSHIARVTHAIGSFHTLTRKPGLLSRIFVHAWNRDMASSFTSIRDRP